MNKFNFTKAAIDALPLPEDGKRVTYHDTNPKGVGLQLRITSSGIKTYCIFRRVKNGNPERVTLGRYPMMTIEQARCKAAEILLQIASGSNPAEIERQRKAEQTFHSLFHEYLERHSKPRKRTWYEDESNYRLYLDKALSNKKLSTITRQDIAKIHHRITKAGYSTQANRVLALISSVFNWGISVDLCNANPAHGIKRNKENERDRFLQADELPKFFEALSQEPNETIRDYFLISLLTGARRSNVLAMRWQDISFDRQEWRIAMTKNGDPQTVPLSPEALQILLNRKPLEGAAFVFPGTGKSGHLEEPKKGWNRILERAGISDLRIHDLRRTLGSWQAKTGASLAIIGKSLNHKNQSTTAIYARLDLDPVRDSVNRATSAILTAAGVKQPAGVVSLKRSKGG
jgi:integrase